MENDFSEKYAYRLSTKQAAGHHPQSAPSNKTRSSSTAIRVFLMFDIYTDAVERKHMCFLYDYIFALPVFALFFRSLSIQILYAYSCRVLFNKLRKKINL